jgi:hypothetical protein
MWTPPINESVDLTQGASTVVNSLLWVTGTVRFKAYPEQCPGSYFDTDPIEILRCMCVKIKLSNQKHFSDEKLPVPILN